VRWRLAVRHAGRLNCGKGSRLLTIETRRSPTFVLLGLGLVLVIAMSFGGGSVSVMAITLGVVLLMLMAVVAFVALGRHLWRHTADSN
jgi:hypothetical protein